MIYEEKISKPLMCISKEIKSFNESYCWNHIDV